MILRLITTLYFLLGILPLQGQQINWYETGAGNGDRQVDQIISFPNGDCLVAGTFTNQTQIEAFSLQSIGSTDIWMARFRENGELIWANSFGSKDKDAVSSMTISGMDSCFIGIEFWDTLYLDQSKIAPKTGSKAVAILKMDGTGALTDQFVLSSKGLKILTDLAISQDGNLLACGYYSDTLWIGNTSLPGDTKTRGFVLQHAASQIDNWHKSIGTNGNIKAQGLTQLENGIVVVGGWFAGEINVGADQIIAGTANGNLFWTAFDVAGNGIWAKRSKGIFEPGVEGLHALGSGGFCMSGFYFGEMDFQNGVMLKSQGIEGDIYLAFFDENGLAINAKSFGSKYLDILFQMNGNVNGGIITGAFQDTFFAGELNLIAENNVLNGFILSYDQNGNIQYLQQRIGTESINNIQIESIFSEHQFFEAISSSGELTFGNQSYSLQDPGADWILFSYYFTGSAVRDEKLISFTIYPNPTHEFIAIDFDDYELMSIFDISGKLICNYPKSNKYSIAGIPNGYYFIQLIKEGRIIGNGPLVILK